MIPSRAKGPLAYWEDIDEYTTASCAVHGGEVRFVIEQTLGEYVHACSIGDIERVIRHLPGEDLKGLHLFVLRQPRRKETILQPVWGRLAYAADIGRPQDAGVFSGPAVFLDAVLPLSRHWRSCSMQPDEQEELERLRGDGHLITRVGRRFRVESDLVAVRNTQLYRTVLHEIGHWVDWLQKVERPSEALAAGDAAREAREDEYFRRPDRERERFAHQYAAQMRRKFEEMGLIPFPPQR